MRMAQNENVMHANQLLNKSAYHLIMTMDWPWAMRSNNYASCRHYSLNVTSNYFDTQSLFDILYRSKVIRFSCLSS